MKRTVGPYFAEPIRRRLAARAVALIVATSAACRAERLQILVAHEGTDAAARRLMAEVRNVGLDPVDIGLAPDEAHPTELSAEYPGAAGVLSLHRSGRIDVAVILPDTGRVVYESTVASQGGTPPSVRAVEKLHGRLVELRLAEDESRSDDRVIASERPERVTERALDGPPEQKLGDAPPPGSESPSASHTEPRRSSRVEDPIRDSGRPPKHESPSSRWKVWVSGAGGLVDGLVGKSLPAAKLEARVAYRAWSIAAFGVLPLSTQSVSGPEGSADIRAQIFGTMIHFVPFELRDVLFVDTGLGGGVAVVTMSGHTSSPTLSGRETSVIPGMALGTAGLGVRISRWLSLRADAMGGMAFARAAVRFGGRDAAVWGPASLTVTGGIELGPVGLVEAVAR